MWGITSEYWSGVEHKELGLKLDYYISLYAYDILGYMKTIYKNVKNFQCTS